MLFIILICVIFISNLKLNFVKYSLFEGYVLRLFETGSSGRDFLWTTLWSKFLENPIIGYGLRYTQEILHKYSHKGVNLIDEEGW